MDRIMLLEYLEMAKRHVAQGERHIAEQTLLLAELERDGHDADEARRLLKNFEDAQRMHIEHLDRLLVKLDALGTAQGCSCPSGIFSSASRMRSILPFRISCDCSNSFKSSSSLVTSCPWLERWAIRWRC